jgi:uncharacterized protein YkwD
MYLNDLLFVGSLWVLEFVTLTLLDNRVDIVNKFSNIVTLAMAVIFTFLAYGIWWAIVPFIVIPLISGMTAGVIHGLKRRQAGGVLGRNGRILVALPIIAIALLIAVVWSLQNIEQSQTVKQEPAESETSSGASEPIVIGSLNTQDLVRLTNVERVKHDLPALVIDDGLNNSAKDKCDDMVAKDYWAHTSPEGVTPWDFIKKYIPSYKLAGENLSSGMVTSEETIQAWMDSAGHKKNILESKFGHIGFAICHKSGGLGVSPTALVVQHFTD